ncbi:MAG TPA: cobyrinic acid a,c-diamide synthase, partial [Acetobacteraceae bacterium]|nr:cobyrinic acid a,c-diamide synthase [Acetobacteraceae bacterium]
DTLLVLATEEPASITDAYAVLKVNAADRAAHAATQGAAVGASADARVVVNQAASHAAGERTYATLAQACQTFLGARPALAGIIRQDAKVREAIRRQCLLLARHPASEAGADVEAMASALL